jgi:hypothetical protein
MNEEGERATVLSIEARWLQTAEWEARARKARRARQYLVHVATSRVTSLRSSLAAPARPSCTETMDAALQTTEPQLWFGRRKKINFGLAGEKIRTTGGEWTIMRYFRE